MKGLICVDPRKRLTVGQAKQHPWLGRHTRELEEVYERAVEDWVKREKVEGGKNVILEYFNLSQSFHLPSTGDSYPTPSVSSPCPNLNMDPYPMGAFSFGAGSSLPSYLGEEREEGEEGDDNSMASVPDLVPDQFTPESSRGCRKEDEPWRASGLYTAEEDELHNAAAGDGRLRSAMELARDVEARRSEKRVCENQRVGAGDKSRFFVGR